MNEKISQAMQENKIFRIQGKFYRKTEDGTVEEMQQVKTEEIVTKGSRRFLRTIMKFIPKQVFMGSKPSSVPVRSQESTSVKQPPLSVGHGESSEALFQGRREGAPGESNGGVETVSWQRKTTENENVNYGGAGQLQETNRTSLNADPQVPPELVRRPAEHPESEGLCDHEQWFKSAQSIYNTERIPSKDVDERPPPTEPIQEVEVDQPNRESESRRDALFENLDEVYGEMRAHSRQLEHECRASEGAGDSGEDGSYVQVRTTLGSEAPGLDLVKQRDFSSPTENGYEEEPEPRAEAGSLEEEDAEFMGDVKEDIDLFMDKEGYYSGGDPGPEGAPNQMFVNSNAPGEYYEPGEGDALGDRRESGEGFGGAGNKEYYEEGLENGEPNCGIYTDEREDGRFFEGGRETLPAAGADVHNEDIPDFERDFEAQENQRTVENNYLGPGAGEGAGLADWGQAQDPREESADEGSLSRRTEVKVQMVQERESGQTEKMHPEPQRRAETQGGGETGDRREEAAQPVMKVFQINSSENGVPPESIGEVYHEKALTGNGRILSQIRAAPVERVAYESAQAALKARAESSGRDMYRSPEGAGRAQKIYTMELGSLGKVGDSGTFGSENRFLKFMSPNPRRSETEGPSPRFALDGNEKRTPWATEPRAEDDGFKARVRKGKTVNVYVKGDEQRTSKKPSYLEQLGRKVKSRARASESEAFKLSLVRGSGAKGEARMRESKNEHLKLEHLDENFGSAHLSDKSETIVRIREGNSVATRGTRGGVDELREFILQRGDSLEKIPREEKMAGRGDRGRRAASGNKAWRRTARGAGDRDHWKLGDLRQKAARRSVSKGLHKSLSGIMDSLNSYNRQILENSQRKRREILDSEKKIRKTVESVEQEKRIRKEFQRASNRSEELYFSQHRRAPRQVPAPQPQIPFAEKRLSQCAEPLGFQSFSRTLPYCRRNPYGEYFDAGPAEPAHWDRPVFRSSAHAGGFDEWRPRHSGRQSERKVPGSVRSSREEYGGHFERERAVGQGRPPQPQPRVVYESANIDPRKRISDMGEYYSSIFERAQQRNRQNKTSYGGPAPNGRTSVRGALAPEQPFEESRVLAERRYETAPFTPRERSFSGNKYMSTISMANEGRVSTNNWDLERFTRKYAGFTGFLEEKIKSFGGYADVDARNPVRPQRPSLRQSQTPRLARPARAPEPRFESFGAKNSFSETGNSNFAQRNSRFESRNSWLGAGNTHFGGLGAAQGRPAAERQAPPTETVRRREMPTRTLKNVRMDSRGQLVKMPLAAKLRRTLNINHFDRVRRHKKKWTALSFGVKGIVRYRAPSVPAKKR